MDINEISTKIKAFIIEEHYEDPPEGLKGDTPLVSSGIIDSISILQVVDFMENNFGIEFEPHEVDQSNLNTIDLMAGFVVNKLK